MEFFAPTAWFLIFRTAWFLVYHTQKEKLEMVRANTYDFEEFKIWLKK